ncbi:MAG: tRNA (N(6)-L-threonylcarbamoyladenosine(37)-C(2))-methylthiotransferase MtaB [Chlamydiota bacterium]
MKKKFSVTTLGCRTNQYESKAYERQLREMGYARAEDGEAADLCIINTCTVTQSADQRSKAKIAQEIKKHPGAKVVVTGCLVDSSNGARERLLQLGKEHDTSIQLVRNQDKESLVEQVFPEEDRYPEFKIDHFSARTRAFVKIQDGCNSFCTYCIIPYVRGRSRSRKTEEILEEIRGLVEQGYKEVVLTGINIGDFSDEGKGLADLIWEVDAIDGLERIRVSSIDPDEVDDPLKEAILRGKKTCPSMHIVLQSGSNVILKRMNRKYTRQMFFDSLQRLRQENPLFTCTTDVIVGFPGESEKDFLDTIDALEKASFAKVHMFPYSPRERTKAATYKDPVPQEEIQRRKSFLLRKAEEIAFSMREAYVGERAQVLVETEEGARSFGHSEHFLPVYVQGKGLKSNTLLSVEIVRNTPAGLEGVCR